MQAVNYYCLEEIFRLLESVELLDDVRFLQYDPDDEADVREIVEKYIGPWMADVQHNRQEEFRLAIAYYTSIGKAPIQQLRNGCQELTLPNADSWERFFARMGVFLFGSDFKAGVDAADIIEQPNRPNVFY